MTTYLARSKWTSTQASGATLTGTELVGVAYHWPGTSQKIIGVETEAQVASRLRGYRDYHVTGRGWRDIGYNVAFDQAGRAWMLRSTVWGVNMVGAHCASSTNPRANHKYVGALLILGADEAPSAAMFAAIRDWYWNRFLARWPGRRDNRGHGQVAGASTSCPGSAVRARLSAGTIPGSKPGSSSGGTTSMSTALEVWGYKNTSLTDRDAYSHLRSGDQAAQQAVSLASTILSRASTILANQAAMKAAVADLAKAVAAQQQIDPASFAELVQEHSEAGVREALAAEADVFADAVLAKLGAVEVSPDSIKTAIRDVLREGVGTVA